MTCTTSRPIGAGLSKCTPRRFADQGSAVTVNVIAAAGLACLLAAVHLQVRVVEEPNLRSVHCSAFTSYERTVSSLTLARHIRSAGTNSPR